MLSSEHPHPAAKPQEEQTPGSTPPPSVTFVASVTGDLGLAEPYLGRAIQTFKKLAAKSASQLEFVFVFDGGIWRTLPVVQTLQHVLPQAKLIVNDAPAYLPAKLFNQALEVAGGRYTLLSRPSMDPDARTIKLLLDDAAKDDRELLRIVLSRPILRKFDIPEMGDAETPLHGWLLSENFISVQDVLFPTALLRKAGGLDCSPILQSSAEWAMLTRLTASVAAHIAGFTDQMGTPPVSDHRLYGRPYPASKDAVQRYIAKQPFFDRSSSVSSKHEAAFLADLASGERDFHARRIKRFEGRTVAGAGGEPNSRPIQAAVTGSFWEYHHNRLCFFNYFDMFAGQSIVSYKSLLDHLVTKSNLIGQDIVFLSRTKIDNVRNILGWCKELRIPSVYMIDDNWFTVAADWPDLYRDLFGKDSPYYKNFLFGVQNADYVLTYNKYLAEDLRPFAKNILMMPNSVELSLFEATPRPASDRFVVGYAGSTRFLNAPFEALGAIGRNRKDVDIVVAGTVLPAQERLLQGCTIIRRPHMDYSRYIVELRNLSVDLLIAPLDNSRTSTSKCPNKYLETTALGAAGVYSKVAPYTWCIRDGENGVFVEDSESSTQWYEAIEGLLDKRKLAHLQAAARADVAKHYDVPIVAKKFMNLISSIVDKNRDHR